MITKSSFGKNEDKEFMTEKEVLYFLFVSRTTLWRIRKKHKIPTYKIEGTKRVYYKRQDIIDALKPCWLHES